MVHYFIIKLKDSVDKTKAKAYLDKKDGVALLLFKLNMRTERFLNSSFSPKLMIS